MKKCQYKMDFTINKIYALQVWFHDGEVQTNVCQAIFLKYLVYNLYTNSKVTLTLTPIGLVLSPG